MKQQCVIKSVDITSNHKFVAFIIFMGYVIFIMFGFMLNWLCGILFLMCILFVYPLCSTMFSTNIELYEKKLIILSGIFVKTQSIIELNKIEQVSVTKDIFGFESLIISTIGGKIIEIPYLAYASIYKELLLK